MGPRQPRTNLGAECPLPRAGAQRRPRGRSAPAAAPTRARDPPARPRRPRHAHAATLAKQHQYVAAEAAQRSLVQAVQGRFGDESAESLSAISALAATLYYQGKLVDARVLQEQALALAIKRSGQSSPDAIIA